MYFANVIKPTHRCNIACSYCFNDDERAPIMNDETLQATIAKTFEHVRDMPHINTVDFIWHGGEPMVVGLKYYQRVVELQRELCGDLNFKNYIQTNGILINDKWLDFFKAEQFEVGISIDGPRAIHDVYRITHSGKGTFDLVMDAIQMCRDKDVPVSAITVLSQATINQLDDLLSFFVKQKLGFEITPMVKSGSARDTYDDLGLEAEEYGPAWIKMYDQWLDLSENEYVFCLDFVLKTRSVLAGQGQYCIGMANCSTDNISTDPVGDLYPCTTLSGHEDTRYGNIHDGSIRQIMSSDTGQSYLQRMRDPDCVSCKWEHVCHGGCVARSYKFSGQINRKDYYCPSLYMIYEHIAKRVKEKGLTAAKPHPHHLSNGIDPHEFKRLTMPANVI